GGLGDVQRSKAEHAIFGFPRRCLQQPLPKLRGALRDAFLLPGRAKHFQAAQRDVADSEQTSFTRRPDGLRLPMIEVVLEPQEVLGHRVSRPIGFPTAHFQRPERVARRQRLPALAVPSQIVRLVLRKKIGGELDLVPQIFRINRDPARACRAQGDDRQRLVVAGKTMLSFLHLTPRDGFQKRQRLRFGRFDGLITWNKVFGESVEEETGEGVEQRSAGDPVNQAAIHGGTLPGCSHAGNTENPGQWKETSAPALPQPSASSRFSLSSTKEAGEGWGEEEFLF